MWKLRSNIWIFIASFYAIQSFIRITGEKTNTENKFVLIGSQAVFKCKFEVSYWFHTDPKKNSSQEIYDGDSVVEKFRKHFEISNSNGEYVLKILDATFEHAGIYACVSPNKTERRFNLIMIDGRISCITSQNSSWISMTNLDNKDVAVNCSLNSRSSCGVAPLLINPDSEQTLPTTDIGFGKGYLWFKVIINEDFETANYKLNFVFQCNISGHQSYYIYHTNYTLQLSLKDSVKSLKYGILLSIFSFLGFCFLAALIHRFKRKKKNNQKERPSITVVCCLKRKANNQDISQALRNKVSPDDSNYSHYMQIVGGDSITYENVCEINSPYHSISIDNKRKYVQTTGYPR